MLAYLGNRGDDMEMRHIKPMFDLGRTRFVFYSPRDLDSMREVIGDADVVVNLIGKYYESMAPYQTKTFPYVGYKKNFSFEDTNVEIARTIAELCTEMQIDNLIHVSSAAASPDSGSEWARTKYFGEQAVKEAYPWATIIRPTQMYGAEDMCLNHFAKAAMVYPMIPLVETGDSLTQPVYVCDVARTISRIIDKPSAFEGKQIDCFGPDDFTYRELAQFVYDITRQRANIQELPKSTFKWLSSYMQYQRVPLFTPDLVELWSEDYLPTLAPEKYAEQKGADKILTMANLGVEATPIEKMAFNFLHRYRPGGHYTEAAGYH